jgi:DNA-binding response OmpR family regulator
MSIDISLLRSRRAARSRTKSATAPSAVAGDRGASTLPASDRPGKARILLAGDDAAQGLMIRRTLESDGYDVVSRATGRDTVLALLQSPADLLLVNAPLCDGSAAALLRWTRARRQSAHMTCMVMVPPNDAQLVAGLYDAGADFVITRRTELDLLSRKVGAALARRPLALAS